MPNFNHNFDIQSVEVTVGRDTIKLETGLIAKQADGAVVASMGDTRILATAVSTKEQKPGISDFTPLTVNYKERTYAAGKIPGGFFKREGKAKDNELPPGVNEVVRVYIVQKRKISEGDKMSGHGGICRPE